MDICPRGLFCPKFDAEKLISEAFFGIMRVFSSVHQPESVCNFPILYHLILKPHFSSPLAPLQGEIDICPHRLFSPKFDAKKLLFEAFFEILHILTTVQYYQRNKWNTDGLFTTRAIKNGVCLHLCCSSALAGPAVLPVLPLAKHNFDRRLGI